SFMVSASIISPVSRQKNSLSARTKRRYPLCTSQGGHNRRRDYHSESLRRVAFSSLAGQVTFRRLSIRIFSYVTVPVSATPTKARCLLGKIIPLLKPPFLC